MLVVANLFWGLSFPLIKAQLLLQARLIPGISSWFSTLLVVAPRFLIAALVLAFFQRKTLRDFRRSEVVQGTAIGLFAAIGMIFQNDGLAYTAASTSAFLTQFYAILIPIWVGIQRRRNPGAVVWVSSILVLVGVAILGHLNVRRFTLGRGEWETLIASCFFMGQILWLDRKEYAGNRAGKITLVMFVAESVVFLILTACSAPSTSAVFVVWKSAWWIVITLALTGFCTLGSFSLMNRWQPTLSATEAGLTYCIEPIFGSIIALFLPAMLSVWAVVAYQNEHATWTLLVGGGLITIANVLIQLAPRQPA